MREGTYAALSALLEIGVDDFLGLWEFAWQAGETFDIDDPRQIKLETIELVKTCLDLDFIKPGFPIDRGPDFAPWNLPVEEALTRMKSAWETLDRDLAAGDVCWFVTTEAGKDWVRRYRQEHPRPVEPQD